MTPDAARREAERILDRIAAIRAKLAKSTGTAEQIPSIRQVWDSTCELLADMGFLLTTLDALTQERELVREAVKKYGQHLGWCAANGVMVKGLRRRLKPRQHFKIVKIDGPRLYYGTDDGCDFLHFGSSISRTGELQGLLVVQTETGDVFVVMPTHDRLMPWVFDRVSWNC